MTRLTAAARTRMIRKIIGTGYRVTSTPASHKAYSTTVHVSDVDTADELWGVLQAGLPDTEIEKCEGFLSVSWPERQWTLQVHNPAPPV